MSFQNAHNDLQVYKVSQPIRSKTELSPLSKPQIS